MCLYHFISCIPCLAKKMCEKNASKSLFISLCIADCGINQLTCRIMVCVPTLRSFWFEDSYISLSIISSLINICTMRALYTSSGGMGVEMRRLCGFWRKYVQNYPKFEIF